jgi:four helix bundle protein
MFQFEKLLVYEDGKKYLIDVYQITKSWPDSEKFGLINQFRRAATSIILNIAEGSSRSEKDFCHFLDIARGSGFECVAIINIAKELGYVNALEYNRQKEQLEKIIRKIQALKKSILQR